MLEQAVRHFPSVSADNIVDEAAVFLALTELKNHQRINNKTGAVHAAAWCSPEGDILAVREDVGRHNALDKLIGASIKAGTKFDEGFALITSRASYEMVIKAASVGIPMLCAVSAATQLAVQTAQKMNMTLLGFARSTGFVIYTHPQRLRQKDHN